jgi:hypothetical protein
LLYLYCCTAVEKQKIRERKKERENRKTGEGEEGRKRKEERELGGPWPVWPVVREWHHRIRRRDGVTGGLAERCAEMRERPRGKDEIMKEGKRD